MQTRPGRLELAGEIASTTPDLQALTETTFRGYVCSEKVIVSMARLRREV